MLKHVSSGYTRSLANSSVLYRHAFASLAVALAVHGEAWALPTGASVESGTVNIQQPTANDLVVNQGTDRAIINWQNFDILNGQTTRFNQPSASSVALNRIMDGNPTQILGQLSANGQLMLVNPNGVFFGAGSRVDTAGLVVSTANISSADFNAGRLNFNQAGRADASIINQGSITVVDGGLVALVAPAVRNDGVIQANLGTVTLGAAQTVAIDMYGDNLYSFSLGEKTLVTPKDENGNPVTAAVENNGVITANGGKVLLTANAAKDVVTNVVNNTGVIEARAAHIEGGTIVLDGGTSGNVRVAGKMDASGKGAGQKGGKIQVTGQSIVVAGADIDASGTAGGGNITIGGDYQGDGSLFRAEFLAVSNDAVIRNDAIETGNGGTTIFWADGYTAFDGKATAKGGAQSGNGGFIEISGKEGLSFGGQVDTTAANGATGITLFDPRDIDFRVGTRAGDFTDALSIALDYLDGDIDFASGLFNSTFRIYESDVETISNTSDVILRARRDFTVNSNTYGVSDGIITIAGGRNLLIETQNNSGTLFGSPYSNAGTINLTGNSTYGANLLWKTSGNGNITINAAVDNNKTGNIVLSSLQTDAGNVSVNTPKGSIEWRGNVTTNGGNVTGTANNQNTVFKTVQTGGGNITLNNTGATWSNDVKIDGTGALKSGGGLITLTNANGRVIVGGELDSGTGNVLVNTGGDLQLWNGSNVNAATLTANAGRIWQQAGGVITANLLQGQVQKDAEFLGATNNITTLGNFATGLAGWDVGGFTLVDTAGLVVDGNVSTNGGNVVIDSNTAAWNQDLKLNSGKSITSKGGDITLDNSVGRLIIAGTIDASGSLGDVNLITGGDLQLWNGSSVKADTLTTNAGQVQQWAGSVIDAQTLTGTTTKFADFLGTANTIGTLGNFTTGTGWHKGGLTLVDSAGGLILNGAVTSTGTGAQGTGNIDIRTVGNLELASGALVNANGGNVELFQTGTFNSVNPNTVRTSGTGTITLYQNAGGSIQNVIDAILNTGSGLNTVTVGNGTYVENVLVDVSNLLLKSVTGRDATAIQGISGVGTLGTVVIANNTNNVQIGDTGKGFTVVGIDNGNPAIENAAVYLQGAHNQITLKNNRITANGDSALVSEYNLTNSNLTIADNIFNGKTYVGAAPAVGNQFVVPNVSRQLVALNKGLSNLIFSGNDIIGDAGLNQLVAIESAGSTITGNRFNGLSSSAALRVRGSDSVIQTNDLRGSGSGIGIWTQNVLNQTLGGTVSQANTLRYFATGISVDGGTGNTVVRRNSVSEGGVGIVVSNTNSPIIDNNTLHTLTGEGIVLLSSNGTLAKNSAITDNLIYKTGKNAIDVRSSADTRIDGNVIGFQNKALTPSVNDNIVGDAIYVEGSHRALITRNQITETKSTANDVGNGIHVKNSNDVVIGGASAGVGNTITNIAWDGIKLTGGNRTTVQNNFVDNVTRAGIYARDLNTGSILNNEVRNVAGSAVGAIETDNGSNLTISNNTVRNSRNNGISLTRTAGTNVINSNTIMGAVADGILVKNGTGNFRLGSNTVGGARNGIHILGTAGSILTNNNVTGGQIGIWVDGSNNTSITGGSILSAATGIRINPSTGVVVDNVLIDGDSVAPVVIPAGSIGVQVLDSTSATIKNSEIKNVQTGISATNSGGLTVDNNRIHDVSGHAVLLSANNGTALLPNVIRDNVIYKTGANAVQVLNSAFTQLKDNAIGFTNKSGVKSTTNNIKGDGIYLEGSNNFLVQGNRITETNSTTWDVGSGIHAKNSNDGLIGGAGIGQGNTITDSAWDGIKLTGGKNIAVRENNVDQIVRVALYARDVIGGVFERNRITNSNTGLSSYGAIATDGGSDLSILANTVDRSGGHGMMLNNTSGTNVLTDNILTNLAFDGIQVNDGVGAFDISRNQVTAPRYAIHVKNTQPVSALDRTTNLADNIITGGQRGIWVDGSNNITITGGSITGALTGIRINPSNGGIVEGVTITGALVPQVDSIGIETVDSSDLQLLDNTLSNMETGIQINGGSGITLTDNSVTGATLIGVEINDAARVRLVDNRLTNNNVGVSIVDTNGAALSGNLFTGNILGVNLDNSDNTLLSGGSITTPTGGTGLRIGNGSGGTIVNNVAFNGGLVGIQLTGLGSNMQFLGNNSSFTGMDFYFVLSNSAQLDGQLDASQQIFDGVRATDFTLDQLVDAELKTIDSEDGLAVGDVFYKQFDADALNQFLQEKNKLFRRGLFSFAGRTINNNPEQTPQGFEPGNVNLSLLGQNSAGQIANLFNSLAPSAGGTLDAKALAALNPSAGGSNPSGLLGNNGFQASANSFLGEGYKISVAQ